MRFENVKIKWLGETKTGTSKRGNDYVIKEVVLDITPAGDQYEQSLHCKAMKRELVDQLDRAKVGDTFAAVDVDFEAREFNGWWKTEGRLWRIDSAPAVAAAPAAPAPVAPAPQPQQAQIFPASATPPAPAAPYDDDLPWE